ncbi:MAG: hypothetical protein A3E37_01030 [Candidatus Andersenbacteria bacterium RIFCSPHIGHO2_12_FULL_46_9]|nr:MAG: hypothetical protein UW94_C0020G0006 [Parcubacteria group bacterium GW2011_GWA2_45_14]OGY35943.1 MAG: hypothetical protein A3B76_04175 [Candidatus Andersenbacteria bacterium RIFCSPHIGHO2_02_FULL_46_16]OGY37695.1 MAG: hypothetical protein A3E37_01030 [Candidatus Andersenbacteria bacterium RIFCSPHIGHO2_12_FULL_46_9]OGY38285.1 MAG: hypothetical protein A3I08_03365 [Candidatus Andersenbacteria bacterium RIFCSPLOWO2_02_FULL_46_11]
MPNPKQILKAKQPPLFAFVDETGITKDPKQPKLGLGLLVIDRQPLVINQVLREVFLCAVHDMKAVEERFKFKFTYITHSSLPYYRAIIDILSQYKDHWHFTSIQAKRNRQPFWSQYLLLLTKLLGSADQPLIVLADHLNKPKRSKAGLSSLLNNTPNLINILQIESQGSILLQVADVLLGATAYIKTAGKDQLKREISQRAAELLRIKTGAGIDPIYATPNIYKDNNK